MPQSYTNQQLEGSEYSGIQGATAGIQPKGRDALNNGEILRLGYVTGDESHNPTSIEDSRQFWGLRPADGRRPNYLENTGQESEAQIEGVGERE